MQGLRSTFFNFTKKSKPKTKVIFLDRDRDSRNPGLQEKGKKILGAFYQKKEEVQVTRPWS